MSGGRQLLVRHLGASISVVFLASASWPQVGCQNSMHHNYIQGKYNGGREGIRCVCSFYQERKIFLEFFPASSHFILLASTGGRRTHLALNKVRVWMARQNR